MDNLTLTGIALGLSLDAFAVSLTSGTIIRELRFRHGLRMSFFFGAFQTLMPILGWAAGTFFASAVSGFDHWIAFGLLAFVGGRMIWEGLPRNKDESDLDYCNPVTHDCRHLPTLLMLSLATSLDALAVGLSFAFIGVSVLVPSLVIGLITFAVSLSGYFIGKKIGEKINLELDIIGGIVLVGIGIKILAEHLLG